MISAYLCWPRVRFFCLHARQWVRRAPGIPCALSSLRATDHAEPGQIMPRERQRMADLMQVNRPAPGGAYGWSLHDRQAPAAAEMRLR